MSRPSDPVLEMLRKVAKQKKMNTAALAKAAEVPRSRMKHILSGSESMTVDELILLSQVLELDPTGMAMEEDEADGDPSEETQTDAGDPAELRSLGRREIPAFSIDPMGNHAQQIVQVGIMLGVDIFLVLDAKQLEASSIPKAVLGRYPERLPITLDAAYHRHHQATYLPEGLQVRLSFDALYTCLLPWTAFIAIHLTPLAPAPATPEPDPEPEADNTPRRGHLRLV